MGREKCLPLHADTVALIKDLHIILCFTYYLTFTITHSAPGLGNKSSILSVNQYRKNISLN